VCHKNSDTALMKKVTEAPLKGPLKAYARHLLCFTVEDVKLG